MTYSLFVDGEWIAEGLPYEQCQDMADNYYADPDFWGDVRIVAEVE